MTPCKLLLQLSNRTVTATAGALEVHRLILPCLKMSSETESQVRAVLFLERDFDPAAEEVCIKHSAFCTDQDLTREFPERLE